MGMAAILVMLPASRYQIFISLYLKTFIQNLIQNGTVVSEKIWFELLYVNDLGPRSRNDLDLQYSHTFMKSISCLLVVSTNFQVTGINSFCKIDCFHFFL